MRGPDLQCESMCTQDERRDGVNLGPQWHDSAARTKDLAPTDRFVPLHPKELRNRSVVVSQISKVAVCTETTSCVNNPNGSGFPSKCCPKTVYGERACAQHACINRMRMGSRVEVPHLRRVRPAACEQ